MDDLLDDEMEHPFHWNRGIEFVLVCTSGEAYLKCRYRDPGLRHISPNLDRNWIQIWRNALNPIKHSHVKKRFYDASQTEMQWSDNT